MATTDTYNKDVIWPALPLKEWANTRATLHMWTQIVGKIRLAQSPVINHWWEVPLYVTARGLTTSPIPYGSEIFEMQFDFIDHKLQIQTSNGVGAEIALRPRSVADFYGDVMGTLEDLNIKVKIWPMPVEIPDPIRFDQDHQHAAYDPVYANRFWRILVAGDTIFKEFRSRFLGKVSPVHFFWGSFDMAVTRFSGRRAPERPGADKITREAYSHEVSSVGFWPGMAEGTDPVFYSYAAPEPKGFSQASVHPAGACYDTKMAEFILKYDDIRNSANPRGDLLDFCQTTYDAAANLANWDRANLERQAQAAGS